MARTDSKNLGARIKEPREAKGWLQFQLGNYLHISNSTVSNYENGTSLPDIEMLCLVADVFNVSTDELLGRTINSSDDARSKPQLDFIGRNFMRWVEEAYIELHPKHVNR